MSNIPEVLGFNTLEEALSFLYLQLGEYDGDDFTVEYTDHCINLLPKDKINSSEIQLVEWDED